MNPIKNINYLNISPSVCNFQFFTNDFWVLVILCALTSPPIFKAREPPMLSKINTPP